MIRDASLSADGLYRYDLVRSWAPGPRATFVMLNPSTADAEKDDPTIRRCIGFAQSWGCGTLHVVNLFALRATDPRELRAADDPLGPENVQYLKRWTTAVDTRVVLAWGAHGAIQHAGWNTIMLLSKWHVTSYAFGLTRGKEPRHPLYLRRGAELSSIGSLLQEAYGF